MSSTPRSSPTAGGFRAGAHLRFEGYDFEHHLNSKEASEDHIEDVHGIVEGSSLLIVLEEKKSGIGTVSEAENSPTLNQMFSG